VAGRYYRVLRSTNLLSGTGTIVRTNLVATPPLNVLADFPPGPWGAEFYQLELEP
jgi:hypothetical protein